MDHPPRSPFHELQGLPWLARLIDKVRAGDAATRAGYVPYPCGGDQAFLDAVGVDPEELERRIRQGASDEALAVWVKSRMSPEAELALARYRAELHAPIGDDFGERRLQRALARLRGDRPGLDTSGVRNFHHLLCVEEGHPLPAEG